MKSPPSLVKQLYALELNGKDFEMAEEVRRAAGEMGMPLVGGSDAHLWPQLGFTATRFPYSEVSLANLKRLIQGGNMAVEIDRDRTFVVAMCSSHKRRMKMRDKRTGKRPGPKGGWCNTLTQNAAIQISFV
jgi:hypothetical protein